MEYALLGLLALLWGSSYTLLKVAVTEIPPLTLIAIRVLLAGVVLFGVVKIKGHHMPREFKTLAALLVQSFLTAFGAWTILAWGQQHVDSALSAVLNSTSPLFVVLITALFFDHRTIPVHKLAGVVMGLFGVLLIVGVDVVKGPGNQLAGQCAALAGAVLYACAALYGKRFAGLPVSVTAATTMLWAAVIMVPAAIVADKPWTLSPSWNAIAAAVALSLFSTALALLIYFRLLNTLGSIGTTSQAYLRAGVGVVLGVTFLDEIITPVIATGLLLAILGVVMINYPVQDRVRQ